MTIIALGTIATDPCMNFQDGAPKVPPRILCIGLPVRDLTFRVNVPARGSKENATHFDEICGGNALNAAIGIVRLGGRASICGPMGDSRETSSRFIFDKLAEEGIETNHLIHMPDLVTPISAIMIDDTGERTIVTFRDPELWKVKLPPTELLLEDCAAILTESRCAPFCTELCAEAVKRGIPVVVDVDRAMSMREGLLTASSHLVFPASRCRRPPTSPTTARRCKSSPSSPPPSWPAPAARRARSFSMRRASLRRARPSRSIPSTRSGPVTSSTARLPSPSPRSRNCGRRCALRPRPQH